MSTVCEKYLEKDIEQGKIFSEIKENIYKILENNQMDNRDIYDKFYVKNIEYGGIQIIIPRDLMFKTQFLKELDDYIGFNGEIKVEYNLEIEYNLKSQKLS